MKYGKHYIECQTGIQGMSLSDLWVIIWGKEKEALTSLDDSLATYSYLSTSDDTMNIITYAEFITCKPTNDKLHDVLVKIIKITKVYLNVDQTALVSY